MMNDNEEGYFISSDNSFADAGRSNPEERMMRVELLTYIVAEIKRRGLSQRQAAALLGVPQPHICLLLQAHLRSFSLERLLKMVARLGIDVAISCQLAASEQGHVALSLPEPA